MGRTTSVFFTFCMKAVKFMFYILTNFVLGLVIIVLLLFFIAKLFSSDDKLMHLTFISGIAFLILTISFQQSFTLINFEHFIFDLSAEDIENLSSLFLKLSVISFLIHSILRIKKMINYKAKRISPILL